LHGEVDGGTLGEKAAVCVPYQTALDKTGRFKAFANLGEDI
jgi:hypothetical protein